MTIASHLVILTVMGAERQAVPSRDLLLEFGEEAFLAALYQGPLYERWAFPGVIAEDGRLVPDPTARACPSGPPFAEVYYAGADARRPRERG